MGCRLTCQQCYRVDVSLEHSKGKGVVQFEEGTNLAAAEALVREFYVSLSVACYYNGPNQVVLSNDFSTTAIVVVSLFGVLPLAVVLMLGCAALVEFDADVALPGGSEPLTVTWGAIVAWFWLGVLLPFVVLLPICFAGAMTTQAQTGLWISVVVLGVVFTLPGLVVAAMYLAQRTDCRTAKLAEPLPPKKPVPVAAEVDVDDVHDVEGEFPQDQSPPLAQPDFRNPDSKALAVL